MAKTKTKKSLAKTDTSYKDNPGLRTELLNKGWKEIQMTRKVNSKSVRNEPFIMMYREEKIDFIKEKTRKAVKEKNWDLIYQNPKTAPNTQTPTNGVGKPKNDSGAVTGSQPHYGIAHSETLTPTPLGVGDGVSPSEPSDPSQCVNTVAVGSGSDSPDNISISCGNGTASADIPEPLDPTKSGAVVQSGSAPLVTSLSDIISIMRMRSEDESLVIGFDTEFYYDSDRVRHILSWQFSFIVPGREDYVQEILVFGLDKDRLLPFSFILNIIIEQFGFFSYFNGSHNKGISYYSTRRWRVPVKNKRGDIKAREFTSFDEAVLNCCVPDIALALKSVGPWKRAELVQYDTVLGSESRYVHEIDGYPIGYINVYTQANKQAVPVTLLCHSGTADITTFDFDLKYEKDMMIRLSQVQGGLVTLESYYLHHPVMSDFHNFYPVELTVRDTMCFAPAKKRKLENLGETIGVFKLDVPKPFSKDDMFSFMNIDVVCFSEYAINDSCITVLYASGLWGVCHHMPVTVSSASARASVPVIKEHFGLSSEDDKQFNLFYRGLKKVSHGKVPHPHGFGFLENTSLEPYDDDCATLQRFAQNAYKGGYNACTRVGYYDCWTNDFDLENAYPTCMSLVPDVDWENCIGIDVRNQSLNISMISSPFAPIFAYVTFRFPDSVQYPCIPISVDGSMVFPRSSDGLPGVYVSGPELYLALALGATVYLKHLIIGNVKMLPDGSVSHSLYSVVKQFVTDRNIAKKSFGKGSLAELLIKEAVNSNYGKTAQDVIDKSTWSAFKEHMVNIGGSAITSPVHSCLTTAGVRCVLLSAMNQLENLGYKVFSVTTDGFISDATLDVLENLDLYGFTRLFQKARNMLVGDPTMWAVKHRQNDLVNFTTRGNASLIVGDDKTGVLPGVMAHNSFVTGETVDTFADRYSLITQVLSREGRLLTVSESFEKFKNLALRENRVDFATHRQQRELSMDFDMKRKPIESSLVNVDVIILGNHYDIANFETEPYDNIDEYRFYKNQARQTKCLRSLDHWVLFFDKINNKLTGSCHNRVIKDLAWSKLMSAVMAYRLQVPLDYLGNDYPHIPFLDDTSNSVEDKCSWINKFNHSHKKFTLNDWKNARRQTRISQMLPEITFKDVLDNMISWDPSSDDMYGVSTDEELDSWCHENSYDEIPPRDMKE